MSIRLRLSLVYTLILAVISIAFGMLLYFGFERSTQISARQRLVNNAEFLVRSITSNRRPQQPRLPRLQLPPNAPAPLLNALDSYYFQIRTLNGEIIRQSDNLEERISFPLSKQGMQTVTGGRDHIESATFDSEDVLIFSRQIQQDGTPLLVQIAQPMWGRNQGLTLLKTILIIGNTIIIFTSFAVGWFMAGYALRPIKRIQQTAQAIGNEQDFGRRVNYTGPNDEVGQLANTFNKMLSQLQDAFQHVEQSLNAQRQFVADASHELRTPLTTVRGNLGLLKKNPPLSPQEKEDVLEDLTQETERLMRLVNDLLVLARADTQRPLRSDPVPVAQLLQDVCQQARILDSRRPIHCHSAHLTVMGDHDSLKQIILILLDNALKHTPANTNIRVNASAEKQHVAIRVADTGPGIDPHLLPHIFDRFYQGDTARTKAGTGLGLAIAKELTEAQHGTLSVESKINAGTTFILTFPAYSTLV